MNEFFNKDQHEEKKERKERKKRKEKRTRWRRGIVNLTAIYFPIKIPPPLQSGIPSRVEHPYDVYDPPLSA